MPPREVDDYEIYNIERRFFQGENAVKLLERVLGIDASITAMYKKYTNYSSYQNNLATHSEGYIHYNKGQTVEAYMNQ